MKSLPRIFLFLCAFLIPSLLFSSVKIDLRLTNQDAQVFRVGDLDITQRGTGKDVYTISLLNTGPEPVVMRLRLEIRANDALLASAETSNFELPLEQTFMFTQTQINLGLAIIPSTQGVVQHPTLSNYNVDLNAINNLNDKVMATGKLPAGKYEFGLQAILQNGQVIADADPGNNILVLSNPTTLTLIFPGRPVNEDPPQLVYTLFPFFQWQGDARLFNLFVYQKFPQDVTVQDVFSHPPILRLENYSQKDFQYPSDPSPLSFARGGRSVGPIRLLEYGKTYYWYVQSVIATAAATPQLLNSEVYRFKVADITGKQLSGSQIWLYLRQILGPRYEGTLKRLEQRGFSPTGKIYLNGNQESLRALIRMAQQLNQGNLKVDRALIY